jgi:transcriptional regulator
MPMYLPPHFEQTNPEAVADLIAAFPLATIVTSGPDGIAANHIPMQLSASDGGLGTLRGHVARNNAVWHSTDVTKDVLAIFQAPDAYISPNWYATKHETHEVVPTWNYAVVHAYGNIRFHDDEKWLRGVIGKLTKAMEADQPKPWNMGQAPQPYTAAQLTQIVGVEIVITQLIAKWKVSQNRSQADRESAAAGLRESGNQADLWIASAIEDNAP